MVALSVMRVLPHGMVRIIVGASAVMLVHFVTNRAMFSVYRSCRFQRPFLYEWSQSLSFSWPQELLELPAVLMITAGADSLNDFAWSLAVAMATTLLVPVERRMNRSSLDIVMRKRARVAPVKAQGLVSGLTTSGSSPGITRRMRTCWAQLLHRLFDGGEGSSDNRASDLLRDRPILAPDERQARA